MLANINIIGEQEKFTYLVDYHKKGHGYIDNLGYLLPYYTSNMIDSNMDDITFWTDNKGYIHHYHEWKYFNNAELFQTNIPKTYDYGEIDLYFPIHNIESYDFQGFYALTATVWIAGKSIVLGSWIIKKSDVLAADKIIKYGDQTYYEKISLTIPDPYSMVYSDEWRDFRTKVCHENFENGYEYNNTGTNLYLTLHPIQKDGLNYIKHSIFTGGQNSINISRNDNDYLNLHISSNTSNKLNPAERPAIQFELGFNDIYNHNLVDYMKETYHVDIFSIQYELVIGNENDIYNVLRKISKDTNCVFTKDVISADNFKNWNGWKEGIYFRGAANIIDSEGESIVYILSNQIPLTSELYKYFIGTDDFIVNGYKINNVNLKNVNMEYLNINAINKIENKITQTTTPNNKTSIVVPVFFRATEVSDIMIHSEVTETICINLDTYKSKVDSFIVQLEGIKFVEIGRTSAGVLFKIIGQKLPKKTPEGTYYVLNQNSELVTTGKYRYI